MRPSRDARTPNSQRMNRSSYQFHKRIFCAVFFHFAFLIRLSAGMETESKWIERRRRINWWFVVAEADRSKYSLASFAALIYARNDKRFQTIYLCSSAFSSTFRFAQESCFFIYAWCLHLMSGSDAVDDTDISLAESINKLAWLIAQQQISRACLFGLRWEETNFTFRHFSQSDSI